MADNILSKNDIIKIHNDTEYFINAITSDYAFYEDFIDALKRGSAEFDIKKKKLKRTVDVQWINVIEESLIYLDNAIRKPSKYIEEQEEVLPIELSHNITNRSLRHLAQHTDYIKKIEGDLITPSKILNVFHEETMQTYENKFLNTLIQRLYIFVNKRYTSMKDEGESADNISMEFSSNFKIGTTNAKIDFNLSIADKNDIENGVSLFERLEHINNVVTRYLNSDFCKNMGKSYVRPPIMRTNAITKNKDLYQCLLLWQYIESYDKVGYNIKVEQSAEKPDKNYINDLYATLALQYLMFRFSVSDNILGTTSTINNNKVLQEVKPFFKSNINDIEVEDFNVFDTEYKKIVPVSSLKNRRLSENELKIKKAIDDAILADKAITARKIAKQQELEKLEKERLEKIKAEEELKRKTKLLEIERKKLLLRRKQEKKRAAILKAKKRKENQRNKKNIKN